LVNYGDQVVFVWSRGRFKAKIPLTSVTNVGILLVSAPGHNVFSSFVVMSHAASQTHFLLTLIPDDEAEGLKSDNACKATPCLALPALREMTVGRT
jgi:hypothetical protein